MVSEQRPVEIADPQLTITLPAKVWRKIALMMPMPGCLNELAFDAGDRFYQALKEAETKAKEGGDDAG